MTKWKTVKLSELGEIIGGATPSTSREDYYNGDIPWLTPKDLAGYSSRYISRGERSITQAGLESCSAKMMPKNTVLFSSRAPIGYIAIAENDICTNQGFKSIVPNADTHPLFLYYLLKYNREKIEAMGSGTTFKEVSGATMRNIAVRIPATADIQEKIAGILDAVDSKIENNQKINDNLDQQAEAVYNHLKNKASDNAPLRRFVQIKHGYAFKGDYISPEDNGIVLVTPGNFKIGGGFKEERCKFFIGDIPENYILRPGSLIVTMTDLSKQADTLGYGAFVPLFSDRIYLHNQRIGLLTQIDDSLPLEYIYRYVRSYEYHSLIVGSASGSTVKHTAPGRILEQAIPVPENHLVEKFCPILKGIEEQIALRNYENAKLATLRDELIPKLLSGEIDVPGIQI